MHILPPTFHLLKPVSARLRSVPGNLVGHAGLNHLNIIIKRLEMTPDKVPAAMKKIHTEALKIGVVTEYCEVGVRNWLRTSQ